MKQRREIPLAEAMPGMSLADNVSDAQGRVLVPAGAELNDGLLLALARREVETVVIECEVEEDPALREARHARIAAELDQRFRLAGEGLETLQLRQTLFEFLKDQR